jgi:hypothetical protein
MIKTLIIGMMLYPQFSLAQNVQVKIEDFSFNYSDPKGSGEATLFQHNQKALEGVRVEVEKIGEAMNFKVSGSEEHEFTLDFLEKGIDVLTKEEKDVLLKELNQFPDSGAREIEAWLKGDYIVGSECLTD